MTYIAAIAVTTFILFIANRSVAKPHSLPIFCLVAVPFSFLTVLSSAPSLWVAFSNGYKNDSFFDLDFFGRAGVITLSSILILLFFIGLIWKSKKLLIYTDELKSTLGFEPGRLFTFSIDCFLGTAALAFLQALSPQVYYQFYHLIFPDLPHQIVVKEVFNITRLIEISTLSSTDSLSSHLTGVVIFCIPTLANLTQVWHHQKTLKLIGVFAFAIGLVSIHYFQSAS